jgi:predicted nucleic acid-binding protein
VAETRIVVSDASPLIALSTADVFDLPRQLFGSVVVTATVRREILAGKGRPGERELPQAVRAGWIRVTRDRRPNPTLLDLDAGEATTLAAALSFGSKCLVLIDDPLAQQRARTLGLSIAGTAGVLLIAKQRGLAPAVRPLLERLMKADFRLSAEVVATVLEDAGEELDH